MSLTPLQLQELQDISLVLGEDFPSNVDQMWDTAMRIQQAGLGPLGPGGLPTFNATVADIKLTQEQIQTVQGRNAGDSSGFREATLNVIPAVAEVPPGGLGDTIYVSTAPSVYSSTSVLSLNPAGPNSVILSEVAAAVARTVAAASGGMEVNNLLTGAGFERVLTTADLGGGITIEDEGTPLATVATTLDFVGAGVVASGVGATKTITIAGQVIPVGIQFNDSLRWDVSNQWLPSSRFQITSVGYQVANAANTQQMAVSISGNDVNYSYATITDMNVGGGGMSGNFNLRSPLEVSVFANATIGLADSSGAVNNTRFQTVVDTAGLKWRLQATLDNGTFPGDAIIATRSFGTISSVEIPTNFIIPAAGAMQVFDDRNVSWGTGFDVVMHYDSVSDSLDVTGATAYFNIGSGMPFRISGVGNEEFTEISHDETDLNQTFTNTVDWNITGLTGDIKAGTIDLNVRSLALTSVLGNSPQTGGAQDTNISFANSGGAFNAYLGFNFLVANTDYWVANRVLGGKIILAADANAFQAPVILAETTPAASGGLLVNNTLTGAGIERVLTTSDLGVAGITGTVANDQVVVGTGASTVDSSAGLTFDGTTLDVIADLDIQLGHVLRVYEFDETTWVKLQHGITNTVFAVEGAGVNHELSINGWNNVNFWNGMDLEVRDGGYIRAQDLTDTDWIELTSTGVISSLTANNNPLHIVVGTDKAVVCTPNGAVNLYHNDISQARTVLTTSGGLEINNTATGAGFERVLTTSDLGGGGVANPMTVDLDGNGFNLDDMGVLFMREQAAADADVSTQGQTWVRTDSFSNTLMFTNDNGNDFEVAGLPYNGDLLNGAGLLANTTFGGWVNIGPKPNTWYTIIIQGQITAPAADDGKVQLTVDTNSLFTGLYTDSTGKTEAIRSATGEVITNTIVVPTDGSATDDGTFFTIIGALKTGATIQTFSLRAAKNADTGADGFIVNPTMSVVQLVEA